MLEEQISIDVKQQVSFAGSTMALLVEPPHVLRDISATIDLSKDQLAQEKPMPDQGSTKNNSLAPVCHLTSINCENISCHNTNKTDSHFL
jgi:hypothetical protein